MMRMKVSSLLGAGVLLAFAVNASAHDLTFVDFGGAMGDRLKEAMLDPFTAQTGIKVGQVAYDGGTSQIRLMVQSKNVTWDLVDVEGQDLRLGCEEGLFEKIDTASMINAADFVPSALGSSCGVGYVAWSTVLAYNSTKVKSVPTGWADFFDTVKYPGKRGLRQGPQGNLEIALLADGVAPADVYKVLSTPEGVDRAFKKLDTIKSSILWWTSGAQPQQLLGGGDVILSAAANGRVEIAHSQGQPLAYTWNGQIYNWDFFAIPVGSPMKAQALQLMKFMLGAKPGADLAKKIPYGPANKSAMPMLSAEEASHLPTSPDNLKTAVATDDRFWAENLESLTERFNVWAAK
jgi:putative spermidine/putrescine transport system substrate-binding protein